MAHRQYSLKPFFTNSDAVRALTLCLNDVVPHVRLAALTMLGRLARLNAAAATPVLRRCLEQLLTDIEHCPDARRLDDSTMLLAEMIRQVRPASDLRVTSNTACLPAVQYTVCQHKVLTASITAADALHKLRTRQKQVDVFFCRCRRSSCPTWTWCRASWWRS